MSEPTKMNTPIGQGDCFFLSWRRLSCLLLDDGSISDIEELKSVTVDEDGLKVHVGPNKEERLRISALTKETP